MSFMPCSNGGAMALAQVGQFAGAGRRSCLDMSLCVVVRLMVCPLLVGENRGQWVPPAASQPGRPKECLHQPALPLGLPPVCSLPVGGGVAQWLCLRSVKQVTGVRFLALVAVLWWTGVPLGRPGWGTGAAELHGAWDPWATEVGAQPTDVVVGLLPVLGVRMPPALRHQPFPWPAGGPQLPPPAFQRRVRPATTPPAGATGWRASPRAGH